MNKEEFLKFLAENDKKLGHSDLTLEEINQYKRENRKKYVQQYFIDIVEMLINKGYKFHLYEEFMRNKRSHRMTDIYIPEHNIVIKRRQTPYHDDWYHNKVRKLAYPIFVDETESLDFVLLKIEDCVRKSKQDPKVGFKVKIVNPYKRKRIRITHEAVKRY